MSKALHNPEAWLSVEFSPAFRFINDVRRFTEGFCYESKLSGDVASSVGMTVFELMQNATTYSEDGWVRVNLSIKEATNTIQIRVENRVTPDRLPRLHEVFERMKGSDPLNHYLELMRETVKRDEGSGLGLARIRFEGKMEVELMVEGNKVLVQATGKLKPDADQPKGGQ